MLPQGTGQLSHWPKVYSSGGGRGLGFKCASAQPRRFYLNQHSYSSLHSPRFPLRFHLPLELMAQDPCMWDCLKPRDNYLVMGNPRGSISCPFFLNIFKLKKLKNYVPFYTELNERVVKTKCIISLCPLLILLWVTSIKLTCVLALFYVHYCKREVTYTHV